MAIATQGTASNYLQRAPSPSGLADVIDLILDKGLVIDAYVRIAVIGIELITVDARIVIASVDTYLHFAESVNRLDLTKTELAGLPELQEKGAEKVTEGAIEGADASWFLWERRGGGARAWRPRPRQRHCFGLSHPIQVVVFVLNSCYFFF